MSTPLKFCSSNNSLTFCFTDKPAWQYLECSDSGCIYDYSAVKKAYGNAVAKYMAVLHKHGTKGHGLVMRLSRLGWWLELMTLQVFPNLNDSVILHVW